MAGRALLDWQNGGRRASYQHVPVMKMHQNVVSCGRRWSAARASSHSAVNRRCSVLAPRPSSPPACPALGRHSALTATGTSGEMRQERILVNVRRATLARSVAPFGAQRHGLRVRGELLAERRKAPAIAMSRAWKSLCVSLRAYSSVNLQRKQI